MSYTKQTWKDGPEGATPITAARLNHMEDGIKSAADGGGFATKTLSAASPQTGALARLNEWTVTNAVQIVLPTGVTQGSQFTVHVLSGFQNLTWPNGTEIFGGTGADEAWVTLVRGTNNWEVLIPSDASMGGGGGGPTVTNLWENPTLTVDSPYIVARTAVPGQTGDAKSKTFTGPGNTVRGSGGGTSDRDTMYFGLRGLQPNRKYKARISFQVMSKNGYEATTPGFGSNWGVAHRASNGAVLTAGASTSALVAASKPGFLNTWCRSHEVTFTLDGTALPETGAQVWLGFNYGRYDVAFKDLLVIDAITDLPIKQSFTPGVDADAAWVGAPNLSPSVLTRLRPSDYEWLSQKFAGRYFVAGRPSAYPDFIPSFEFRVGDSVVDSSNPRNVYTQGATGFLLIENGEYEQVYNGMVIGGTTYLVAGALGSTDWGISTANGASTGQVTARIRSDQVLLRIINIEAKVANPAGVLVVLPEHLRPNTAAISLADVPTSNGGTARLRIDPATGNITLLSAMAAGVAFGVPGSSPAAGDVRWTR